MPFPKKFRNLIDLTEADVTVPDYVWLAYAVCATGNDSCGWAGWIIESAWKKTHGKKTDVGVEADVEQRCPKCNGMLFRTEVEKQFRLSRRAGPKIDFPYKTAPIKYK